MGKHLDLVADDIDATEVILMSATGLPERERRVPFV